MAGHGNEESWNERVEKQEERVQKLEANVFQLANYYFVFQGVIFTAIFGTHSSLKCHYRLVPFLLSLTAATLNLMALYMIGRRYIKSLHRLEADYSAWFRVVNGNPEQADQQQNGSVLRPDQNGNPERADQVDQNGVLLPDHNRETENQHIRNRLKEWEREAVLIACMVLFAGFAGINLYATWIILCHDS